ncbi:uncharacterized protein PFL1_04044 [Pseudozyma flocculosa PF-1]|uniref:Related to general alpha-glucoside permease n=2 Tax=Pseudozyma flocculosa TaxID=84751 RepID=A0A5C3ESN0_9BASI|nr:uncharacterized protein PFL1_04044 [Pseudozyma flocculosa PF-1]EPQ28217.1 hypothetical protein PFL1_04044 [Pseudozyma flocculosa PF-1]SPO35353.1 related to general alpha-glucoside permease [Pseudozyma flocculosa]
MVGGGGGGPSSAGAAGTPHQKLVGHAYVRAPPALQLPLLSLGTLGAQAVWSIDMAFAPPYLLELGLSKSAMAAVFVAGPLSGLVVQPLIGALADNSTSRHGRRRPLLVVGAVVCSAAVLLLSFAREVASIFATSGADAHSFLAICIAIVAVYVIDFSVNAVTALNRALMVDVASIEDQAAANAWAARLSGTGSVLSFCIGNLDLPGTFPRAFGTTQIQILSVLTCLVVLATHAVVVLRVHEQVLVRSTPSSPHRQRRTPALGLAHLFRDLVAQAKNLPAPILEIFKIQFFAWIGWFPILFYTTVWIGDIYRAGQPGGGPQGTSPASAPGGDALFDEATRVGSLAMFWHAVVALAASIVLPIVVPSPLGDASASTAATPGFLRGLERLRSRCPDLTFWWVFSHFVFCAAMMGTYIASLAQSVFFASLLIAIVGFCWCVTNWVPFGLLGILIQHHTPDAHEMRQRDAERGGTDGEDAQDDDDEDDDGNNDDDDDDDVEAVLVAHPGLSPRRGGNGGGSGSGGGPAQDAGGTSGHSGSILGLHNLAIVLPQFAVTMISSAIFAIMEPSPEAGAASGAASPTAQRRAAAGPAAVSSASGDAVGIVLRLGGLSALVAGVLAVRFARRYGHVLSE